MPGAKIRKVPPELSLKELIGASFDPETKLTSYDPRVRSKWVQLVGSNPHLLYGERKRESFDLMEEAFEKWSWDPRAVRQARAGQIVVFLMFIISDPNG